MKKNNYPHTLLMAVLLSAITVPIHLKAVTLDSDGSAPDVQRKILAAASGDVVTIPAGVFNWASGITINKPIHLMGRGAGRVVARSETSVAIGKGTKTINLIPLKSSNAPTFTQGQPVRLERTGSQNGVSGDRGWMKGTVTSFTNGLLTVNVTETAGSGIQKLWIVSTAPTTTIVNNTPERPIQLDETSAGNIRVSNLHFQNGTGTPRSSDGYITISNSLNGKACIIHDCYFEINDDVSGIHSNSNRGLVYNCSFPSFPYTNDRLAFHHVCNDLQASWETPSTMGTADKSGESNFYFENCDFHAFGVSTDFDANSRAVLRRCSFNNAGLGTHGADTGHWGMRHLEVYDSEFIYNGYDDGQTFPMNWQLFLRGGTVVMKSNIMPNMECQDYGDKTEINMTVMNLQRDGGPNPCWGAGKNGIQYPAPRQVGRGYINGSMGRDSITYIGESEPCYFWDNQGGYTIDVSDYGGTGCQNYDSGIDYIKEGRDYFNNGTPKPGYTPYVYPHPLRSTTVPSEPKLKNKVLGVKAADANE